MIQLYNRPTYILDGRTILSEEEVRRLPNAEYEKGTIAHGILTAHNQNQIDARNLQLKFDALASHDITYVGIIQTAKASGLEKFPVPYVLTNCHNSLCAVGGTINEDDHLFGLSAAKKYGGIYVPAHQAVIHQYMREMMAGCGKMILGSDSHTRYGAFGTMAIGEGGPELVKQILSKTYDVTYPEVIAVVLNGEVRRGVGPQDVALAIIKAVFKDGFVKNKVMEFVGEGISKLSVDFRCGIDVMTTETTCLSSIWMTDEKVREMLTEFGRPHDYAELKPAKIAKYDGAIVVDLSKVEPMIAMPFHPSNVYRLADVIANPYDVLSEVENSVRQQMENPTIEYHLLDKIENNRFRVQQGIIAGCAGGTYENLAEAAQIVKNGAVGSDEFAFSVYPSSQPVFAKLIETGAIGEFVKAGAVVKTAFCGPCFGAGDTPANDTFSIRHTTRNFPSREGSKPGQNQIASVALMDARSIAATAANGGYLTSALDVPYDDRIPTYTFDASIYEKRIFSAFGKGDSDCPLRYGPNIADWPNQIALCKNVLLRAASVITDEVTTTDELIPSGETSSYRSNPLRLAEFALSRKDPKYVSRAKETKAQELLRQEGKALDTAFENALKLCGASAEETEIGSFVFANKPGDGSAREQAASCQRVLGGLANIAVEYATKRYRSNLINWGMLPLRISENCFEVGDFVFIEDVLGKLQMGAKEIPAKLIRDGIISEILLTMDPLTEDERKIIQAGCLINFNRN